MDGSLIFFILAILIFFIACGFVLMQVNRAYRLKCAESERLNRQDELDYALHCGFATISEVPLAGQSGVVGTYEDYERQIRS